MALWRHDFIQFTVLYLTTTTVLSLLYYAHGQFCMSFDATREVVNKVLQINTWYTVHSTRYVSYITLRCEIHKIGFIILTLT